MLCVGIPGPTASRFRQSPEVVQSPGRELCVTGEVGLFDGVVRELVCFRLFHDPLGILGEE